MRLSDTTALIVLILTGLVGQAAPPVNTRESAVRPYSLPDPLSGCPDLTAWENHKRAEWLETFRTRMHGHAPPRPADMKMVVTAVDSNAMDGLAVRSEATLTLFGHPLHLLLYRPRAAREPAPVFLSLNFDGNHTVDIDPGITLRAQWVWNGTANREELQMPSESTRGQSVGRWPIRSILSHGYAIATLPRADVEPDYPEGWRHGLRGAWLAATGRMAFADDDWGAIAAWAWSLSRAMDYIETDPSLDARRVLVAGHSRLGKAALWAGAADERFAMVISNNSGEGGAALARRNFGETLAMINQRFPHWFCANYRTFNDKATDLPFDAHTLIALCAPRPVYVASASEDTWADPRGEFLAALAAGPVYGLYGRTGLSTTDMPGTNEAVGSTIRYHVRAGKHDMTEFDWNQYLDFADRWFTSHHTQ